MKKFLFLIFLPMSTFFADEGLSFRHQFLELQQEVESLSLENMELRQENENLRSSNVQLQDSYEHELFLRQTLEQENDLLNHEIEGLRHELDELIDENEVVTESFNFCKLQLKNLSGQSLDDFVVNDEVEEQE